MRNFIGVIFVVGAMAPVLGAQQTVPGWVVEQKTSMIREGATSPTPMMEMRMHLTIAGGDRRMDIIDGPTAGEYTLIPADGRVTLLVVPSRRVARELPKDPVALSAVMAPGTTLPPGALKTDTLGDGPVMLGYRTRHYRVSPSRPTMMSMPGFGGDTSQRVSVGYVMDYYVTDQLPELAAAGFVQRAQSPVPGAVPGFIDIPLRTEIHIEMGSGGMKTMSVIEVTSVSKSNVDPALFTVPADYAHVSFADEMRDLRARNDSLMQGMKRDYPGMAALLKAQRDSMFGIRDTTTVRKP